jgi:hypothetical protein
MLYMAFRQRGGSGAVNRIIIHAYGRPPATHLAIEDKNCGFLLCMAGMIGCQCRHHVGLSPSRGLRHEQYIGVSTGYLAVPVSGGLCYSRIELMLTSMCSRMVGMGRYGGWGSVEVADGFSCGGDDHGFGTLGASHSQCPRLGLGLGVRFPNALYAVVTTKESVIVSNDLLPPHVVGP